MNLVFEEVPDGAAVAFGLELGLVNCSRAVQ
jgi:hypothetical protein